MVLTKERRACTTSCRLFALQTAFEFDGVWLTTNVIIVYTAPVISHSQVLPPMKTTVVSHQSGTVRLQIDIDISGAMLAVEERIQDAVNDLGRAATGLALEQFDTDGSP